MPSTARAAISRVSRPATIIWLPSRWLFGVEADVSFPNTIAGTSTLSSASTGTASYAEQVEFSGTLRGRIGYAPNLGTTHWLFYATGGFA